MAIGFLERSRIERAVLKVVNESVQAHRLSGLSEGAVVRWANNFAADGFTEVAASARGLLLEISHRIRSNSDASKHVFAGEALVSNSTTEICIEELRKTLSYNQ